MASQLPTLNDPGLAPVEKALNGSNSNGDGHDKEEEEATSNAQDNTKKAAADQWHQWSLKKRSAEQSAAAGANRDNGYSTGHGGNAGEFAVDDPSDNSISSSPSTTDTVATEPLPQPLYGRAVPQPPVASAVKLSAHCHLRPLPGTGGEGDITEQGAFATHKIDRGTRIISERPLITLPAPGDQLEGLMKAYRNLTVSDQERIWNLRPAAPDACELLQNLKTVIDPLAFDLQNILAKDPAEWTVTEMQTLAEMGPTLKNAIEVWRIAARWHANRSSMIDCPEDQCADLPEGKPFTGLFVERAQLRHSCVPNCFASYDSVNDRMNVHVTRDIAEGEELTASAFAGNMYYGTAGDRKAELSAWGLTCNCEACDETHPKFKKHEEARQRAHARVVLLIDFCTRLETEEMEEDELNNGQEIILSLIRDLKATGCETVESVRWRNILVDRILPARTLVIPEDDRLVAWQIILGHAKECEKVGRVCYGEDRAEFKMLSQTREATQNLVEQAKRHDAEQGVIAAGPNEKEEDDEDEEN